VAVNDIVQANIIGSVFNQTTVNSLWYFAQSGPGSVTSLLHQVNNSIIAQWKNGITSEFTLVRLDGSKVFPLPRAFVVSLSLAQAGLGTPPTVPSNVAMTITKQTAFAGRKYRGRWFITGHSVSGLANGVFTSTTVNFWQSIATEMATNLTDSDGTVWVPILLHGRIPTTGTASYTPIVQCRANPTPRNQRRRQIGIGI
jgi:hypothetical protein